MQVSGSSAAGATVQIRSTGPDGEVGGGDDETLGSGTCSAGGIFVVSLSRALVDGESIYPVDTIDQGIEILTGQLAGERDENGHFPDGSINQRVEKRLTELAERWHSYSAGNGIQRES